MQLNPRSIVSITLSSIITLSRTISARSTFASHHHHRHHHLHHDYSHSHHDLEVHSTHAQELNHTDQSIPHFHVQHLKRDQCAFPYGDKMVAVTPDSENAGWAMSPDQPCLPGGWCPYACEPGYLMAQWNPEATSYTYPLSMDGGLYCNTDGTMSKPFPNKDYCVAGVGSVVAQNSMGSEVAFCQTVLPGNEAMLIPTTVGASSSVTLAVPDTSYWASTAAHYYINPAGVSASEGCVWGSTANPWGNWSPYVAGANTDGNGNTFVKVGWNPIYTDDSNWNTVTPSWAVKIECEGGGCNGLPCYCDPAENGINGCNSGTDGAGDAAFCVVTVPSGSKANIVVYESGSDSSAQSESESESASPSTSSATTASSAAQVQSSANAMQQKQVQAATPAVLIAAESASLMESSSSPTTSSTLFVPSMSSTSSSSTFEPTSTLEMPDVSSTSSAYSSIESSSSSSTAYTTTSSSLSSSSSFSSWVEPSYSSVFSSEATSAPASFSSQTNPSSEVSPSVSHSSSSNPPSSLTYSTIPVNGSYMSPTRISIYSSAATATLLAGGAGMDNLQASASATKKSASIRLQTSDVLSLAFVSLFVVLMQ